MTTVFSPHTPAGLDGRSSRDRFTIGAGRAHSSPHTPAGLDGRSSRGRGHEGYGRWREEQDRERRARQVRRVTTLCGLTFALYLVAGAVFSSMGWNAWMLLGAAWATVVAFAVMGD